MTPAIILALAMLLTDTPPADSAGPPAGPPPAAQPLDDQGGEPLPPGAPTDSYQLSAWCYGALDEYLTIYDTVKPDLKDMDRLFGTSVVEDEPYHTDMDAARVELKLIGQSVTEAEKASPRPISEQGLMSIKRGRGIWSLAEAKTRRELARAWMLWALPDRCASNAKELTQRSLLFGKALNYNNTPPAPAPDATPAPPPADAAPAGGPTALEAAPGPAAAPQATPPAATEQTAGPSTDTSAPASPQTTPAPDTAPAEPTRDPGVPPYPNAAGADQPKAASPQP